MVTHDTLFIEHWNKIKLEDQIKLVSFVVSESETSRGYLMLVERQLFVDYFFLWFII